MMAGLAISELPDYPTGPVTGSEKETTDSTSRRIPHLLLAYSESTTEDVIRPCFVKSKNGSTPFLQWFGFSRDNEGLLQLYPYTETRTYDFELPEPEDSSANLSSGIPFLRSEIDRHFTVDLDLLKNEEPVNYATYELVTDTYQYDIIYIIRLMSSVSLWRCIAERLWERANRSDAILAFDTFRLLRESFLQKTSNEGVVELKVDHVSVAALKILRDGGLLDGVIEEMCLVDEQSRTDSIRKTAAAIQVETWYLQDNANEMFDDKLMDPDPLCIDGEHNYGPQLSRWIHYCKGLRATGCVGTAVEARSDYRWFYEDWPRPRSIFPGNALER
ncbi:hypothetical protein EG328_008770 [Venturia inaequalis]|uniref:Uncharacterized protein n=1 Tax=Venturia inaequalis TaxID=5025 RepID=A0A8H3UB29_VENIN|nr:hypothetical protein EG328_008770 [Venturia inaequalis]